MAEIVEIHSRLLRRMPLPQPSGEVDKNSRGRVLMVGGSHRAPGATLLSGVAALRAGAGKIQFACPRSLALPLGIAFPEAGVCGLDETADGEPLAEPARALEQLARNSHSALLGPGMLSADAASVLTQKLLATVTDPVFVVDALALTGLWEKPDLLKRQNGKVVLTPHAGEMASLTHQSKEQIESDPVAAAVNAAAHCGSVVVLKGGSTFIASPSGETFHYEDGVVGLATAGSGDVLAGLVAGLAARGADPLQAAIWGVYLHGEAGRCLTRTHGTLGFLARELADQVPKLLESFRES
jgi:hydroxyethylthiazole kinase-like uncharacterized protein yjeF